MLIFIILITLVQWYFYLPLYFCISTFYMNLANRILVFLMTCLVFVSCQDDEKQRAIEQLKQQNKQDEVFETINTSWNFNGNALNASSQKLVQNWQILNWYKMIYQLQI